MAACMQVAADVLSGGRSSRLIKNLVLRNACLSASCLPGYPGDLHPGLALVSAVPQEGEHGGLLAAASRNSASWHTGRRAQQSI